METFLFFVGWYFLGLLAIPLFIRHWTSPKRSIPLDYTKGDLGFNLFFALLGPFTLAISIGLLVFDILPFKTYSNEVLFKARRE